MSRIARSVMVATVCLLLSACGEDTAEAGDRLDTVVFDTVATIGALDGDEHEVFGIIHSVAVSERGEIAILDGQAQSVAVFRPDGGFVGSLTTRGEGPGELAQPWGVAWVGEGDLVVTDVGNSRFSRYIVEDSDLQHSGSLRMEFPMWPTCAMGERVFASAYREEGMVHRLQWEDESRETFGSVPAIESVDELDGTFRDLARLDWTVGRLLCDEPTDRVLEVGILNGNVRMFTGNGETLWEHTLDDIHMMEPLVENGAFRGQLNEITGAHVAQSVFRWDADHALVQYELRFPPGADDERPSTPESRLINLETGAEEARTHSLPRLEGRWGDRFIGLRNEPFPQVLILEQVPE